MAALGKMVNMDWTFTINFSEASRRPRDNRPLSRWGVLIVADRQKSDFRLSALKNDGAVNDLALIPIEAQC